MKTGMMSRTAVILAAMLAVAGCSSAMTRKTESVEGARIERQAVIDGIKPGETTRQMVIDAFGPPSSVNADDGAEKIIYEFKEKKVPVYFGVVENETARTETSATLEVVFKGDIVSSFRYRASEK
ncbi:MAG: hypothetical protein HY955_02195 [Deltaproteobacteria bacterium]|nr:hypothetical protein [Deltaproteobacteria bacterium]